MHRRHEMRDNPLFGACQIIDRIIEACRDHAETIEGEEKSDTISQVLDALRFDWIKLCALNSKIAGIGGDGKDAAKQNIANRITRALDRIEAAVNGRHEVLSDISSIRECMASNPEACGHINGNNIYRM